MPTLIQYLTSKSAAPNSGPPPSRRLTALILAVALVFASTFPGFAAAGEVDSEGEGSTPPIEIPVAPPDFDPGGEDEGLEVEVPAVEEEETVAEPEAEVEIETTPVPEEAASAAADEATVGAPPPPSIYEPEPEASAPDQPEAGEPSEPITNAELVAPQPKQAANSAGAGGNTTAGSARPVEDIQENEAPPSSFHEGNDPPVRPDHDLSSTDSYVVRPGDCLWHIAAAVLPAGSDAGAIAAKVFDLWHLNRDRIGNDPNLIYPGTVLRLH